MTTYEWSDRLDALQKSREFVIHQIETNEATRQEFEAKLKNIDNEINEQK